MHLKHIRTSHLQADGGWASSGKKCMNVEGFCCHIRHTSKTNIWRLVTAEVHPQMSLIHRIFQFIPSVISATSKRIKQ